MNLHDSLMTAVAEDNLDETKAPHPEWDRFERSLRSRRIGAVWRCLVCRSYSILLLMLEHGADPNFIADEPAASIYTRSLMRWQSKYRFLMDWDKYDQNRKVTRTIRGHRFLMVALTLWTLTMSSKRAGEWQRQKSA